MDPVITVLHLGEVERPVGSYGVLLSVALIIATALAVRAAVRSGLDGGETLAAAGFTMAGGFAGSYLAFVIVEWIRTGSPMPAMLSGGLVFLGAPVGGALGLGLACYGLRLPFFRLADLAVPALAAAHAMGRLGCFFGGCCFGKPWDGPWAVTYTHPMAPAADPSVPRHPVPLYEAGVLLLIALILTLIPPREVGRGRRFFTYLLMYGVARIGLETLRGDAVRGVFFSGWLSTSQLLSAIVLLVAVVGLSFPPRARPLPAR